MKIFYLFIFLLSGLFCFSQQDTSATYLLIRIEYKYDNTMGRSFCSIKAERGCEAANEIYSLKTYDYKKNAVNAEAPFYYNISVKTNNIYNYFLSATEALNFLSKNGWTLFSVYTETFSGYNNQTSSSGEIIPITSISSRPVYCFTK